MTGPVSVFTSAATAFVDQVRAIPDSAWAGPGLGDWDLRALVGHTSRSLTTVSTYLQTTAQHEDIPTPQGYYAAIRPYLQTAGDAVAERGRQAGRDLGADPAATVEQTLGRALADLDGCPDRLIEVIGGLGIRLFTYLPTRVFELVVHGFDIARATGQPYLPPAGALEQATELAVRIAAEIGSADAVLLALTGRAVLPEGFSVV